MNFHTLLIDADILLHRAVRVAAVSVEFDGIAHTEVDLRRAGAFIREELGELKARFDAKRVLLALGDRTGNFRKELCPTYKSNRTGIRPPGFMELEAKLRAHAKVVQIPRLEGDDVLGLLATKEPTEGKLIVSIDHDLLQVPGRHYNWDTEALTETTVEDGALRHLAQTLAGDRGDGYAGCPGVGPVKATAILAGDSETRWERVVTAFEKAGQTEEQALLQARLAFVLRQGWYDAKTKEIKLWTPE